MKRVLVALGCVLCSVAPSSLAAVDSSHQLESQPYVHNKEGFKIRPPKGWTVNESGQLGTLVIFSDPSLDHQGKDPFRTNINITSEATQNMDLDKYIKANKEALGRFLQNYRSTEERTLTVNGRPIRLIGGTFIQGIYKLRNQQMFLIRKGKAFIVTATTLESTWNKHKSTMEASLLTFQL